MNIETVNELIQSLESSGELSIKERKYLTLAKAYLDVAAENVALKASIPPMKMINDVTDSWDDVSLAEEVGFNRAISAIMKNIPETPATARILAEAEARGVEKAIAHLEKKFSNIGVQIMNLQWLADSLRGGNGE